MAIISVDGVENVRDLGGISVLDDRKVKSGLFFRGANLSGITKNGAHFLSHDLGVSLVIDLRVGWETEEKPDVPIPGVEYVHLPFYDKDKVGIDYTEKAQGTQLVGKMLLAILIISIAICQTSLRQRKREKSCGLCLSVL